MPLYDYECPEGHTFEALGRPAEPRQCPCGRLAAPKIGAPAFTFKGPGFTDKGRPLPGKPSRG